ncbi:MAG: PadR family transcriptional regulator [Actinomycetota bacterium]
MPVETSVGTLTATECAILGLLARGPQSGYDLKRAIDGSVGYFWGPAKSQIYAVLPRLVEAGYATSRKVAQARRPDKEVYRITSSGRAALRSWIEETPTSPTPDRNPLLLKIFFGDYASAEVLLEQVRGRRAEMEQLKAELDAIDERARGGSNDFFPQLTRMYGRRYAEAIISWADDVERMIGERKKR